MCDDVNVQAHSNVFRIGSISFRIKRMELNRSTDRVANSRVDGVAVREPSTLVVQTTWLILFRLFYVLMCDPFAWDVLI